VVERKGVVVQIETVGAPLANTETKKARKHEQKRAIKARSRELKWLTMVGKWREYETKHATVLKRRIRKGT
jgi:hypothetical protein